MTARPQGRFAKLGCGSVTCDDVHTLCKQHKSLSINMLRRLAQRSTCQDNASYRQYDVSYRRLHTSSLLRHASTTHDNASYQRCDASCPRFEASSPRRRRPAPPGTTPYRRCETSYRRYHVSPYPDDASNRRLEAWYRRLEASYRRYEACHRRLEASNRRYQPVAMPFPASSAECRDLDSDSLDWPRESENGQYSHAVQLTTLFHRMEKHNEIPQH